MDTTLWLALAGGVLVGLGAGLLFLLNGRMSGVTGILAGATAPPASEAAWRLLFLGGLVAGGLLGPWIAPGAVGGFAEPWPVLALAGALVGFGARLGGGCTSGHGVCGVGRLSPRSLVGCATFMTTAMIVVFIVRHVLR
jgi:uncharacterized membrane protein YedE/YeeE